MTQKHTPEPWITVVHASGNPTLIQANGNHLAECWSLNKTIDSKANAARIVACVNEFAGKSNEEVKGYVEAMDAMYKNYCNLQSENILLKEQIEKLKEGK